VEEGHRCTRQPLIAQRRSRQGFLLYGLPQQWLLEDEVSEGYPESASINQLRLGNRREFFREKNRGERNQMPGRGIPEESLPTPRILYSFRIQDSPARGTGQEPTRSPFQDPC